MGAKPILPVISSILSNLCQIESIVLCAVGRASWPLAWSTLDLEFRTAFRNSIRLPSIKEVVISTIIGFSLSTFDNCENLRRLQLYGQCTNGEGVSYPRLSSLGVSRQRNMTRIVSWAKANTIHTLSFLILFCEELPQFRNLIEACSTTLVKLELKHVMSGPLPNPRMPVFPELRLPVLEHIVFRFPMLVENRVHYSFLPLLVPFLRSIKSISPLSPIHLTLHLELELDRDSVAGTNWSIVASIIVLPVFRHPIELYINRLGIDAAFLDVVSSLKQNSDMKRLLSNRKLVIIGGDE